MEGLLLSQAERKQNVNVSNRMFVFIVVYCVRRERSVLLAGTAKCCELKPSPLLELGHVLLCCNSFERFDVVRLKKFADNGSIEIEHLRTIEQSIAHLVQT